MVTLVHHPLHFMVQLALFGLTSLQFCLTFLVLGSMTSRPSLSLTSTQIRLVSFGGSVANAGCASVKHSPATNIIFFIVIFLDSIQA